MIIKIDLTALRQIRWCEYAVRFLFGGMVTVVTGILAKRYGPVLGGLFLAFPAIFPASVTLVSNHESERTKARPYLKDVARGRKAAALEARGAAMGSVGLAAFACAVWMLLTRWSAPASLGGALAVWIGVSVSVWRLS